MKDILSIFKWLLEADIRVKNAASFLFASVSMVALYFAGRHTQWFQELRELGTSGVLVAVLLAFVIPFLAAWLVCSGLGGVALDGQRVSGALGSGYGATLV